jgi:hypothetical protein
VALARKTTHIEGNLSRDVLSTSASQAWNPHDRWTAASQGRVRPPISRLRLEWSSGLSLRRLE